MNPDYELLTPLHADERFGPELRGCCDVALDRPRGALRDEAHRRA